MNEKRSEEILEKLKKDFLEMAEKVKKGLHIIEKEPNPDVGTSPKDVIYSLRRLKVYKYKGNGKYKTPLLLVPSLINGYYILDLLSGFSLVEYLVSEGFSVYTADWGYPDEDEKDISFDYYIETYLKEAVGAVKEDSPTDSINILGYCMGGNLAIIYASLYPKDINAYISLASPVDFDKGGILRKWLDKEVINLDKFINYYGNIPTDIMDGVFPWIKPSDKMKATGYLLQNPENTAYARLYKAIMQWREDNVPFPGNFCRKFVSELYRENKLMKSTLKIGRKKVDLKKIKFPVLNIIASKDYIAPPLSCSPLKELVSSTDYTELNIDGGHLDIILNILIRMNAWGSIKDWLSSHSA
jgi:polyhydroxyalkanoate synthase